jgi:hypothetical protein
MRGPAAQLIPRHSKPPQVLLQNGNQGLVAGSWYGLLDIKIRQVGAIFFGGLAEVHPPRLAIQRITGKTRRVVSRTTPA